MRQDLLILGVLGCACVSADHADAARGGLAAQAATSGPAAVVDDHVEILDAYLRGRRQWLGAASVVGICWPVRDSLPFDDATVRALVAGGGASRVDVACRKSATQASELNIFEIKVERDTARILAGRELGTCEGLEERGIMTRASVPGSGTDQPRASGPWTVREITLKSVAGGDCVVVTNHK